MINKNLKEVYHQLDNLWTSSTALKELRKTVFIPEKDFKRWLARK